MYKQALIIADVISVDGNPVLDVPFTVYGVTAVRDNRIFYQLTDELIGKRVLALVTYMVDHPVIHRDDTYAVASLGDNIILMPWQDLEIREDSVITDFYADERVLDFWNVTNADFRATFTEEGVKIPYTGQDADELAPFYPSDVFNKIAITEKAG